MVADALRHGRVEQVGERAVSDRVEHSLDGRGIDHADMPAGERRVVFEVEQAHGAAHSLDRDGTATPAGAASPSVGEPFRAT